MGLTASSFGAAAGEYIAPERIEGTLTKTSLVQQIFVHGNPFESSVVAVVVPNQAELTCGLPVPRMLKLCSTVGPQL